MSKCKTCGYVPKNVAEMRHNCDEEMSKVSAAMTVQEWLELCTPAEDIPRYRGKRVCGRHGFTWDEEMKYCNGITPLEVQYRERIEQLEFKLLQTRKAAGRAWGFYLESAFRETFDDGTSVMEVVLATNPELKKRLRKAFGME